MRPLLKVLLGVVVAGLLGAGGTAAWFQRQANPPGPPGEEVAITIPEGASTQRISSMLEDEGVITSDRLFRIYLRVRGAGSFAAGDYTFRTRQNFSDVLTILRRGPQLRFDRLTVPEGFTLEQIAERVGRLPGRSAERFLELARGGEVRSEFQPPGSTNLEGLLFPDTYFLDEADDELAILRRMVTQFDRVANEVGIPQAQAETGLSPYEAIVVASLIEAEGKITAERPRIAQVIYNRLERGMLLQIDATVIYARGNVRRPDGRVLYRDLEVDSPYNTYRNRGLPPTPIAAVARTALEAALDPEDGPWLFYVKSEHDGTHKFGITLEDHNRNIADARRRGIIP